MLAFHNDPAIKKFYTDRVDAHRAADEIRHGVYWEHGKGCAVGCTIHSGYHMCYEREIGFPLILAYVEDGIFEALGPPYDKNWPCDFLEAAPVGADLSLVWPHFFLQLATDMKYGMLQYVQEKKFERQKAAINAAIHIYTMWITEKKKPASTVLAAARANAEVAAALAALKAAERWALRQAAENGEMEADEEWAVGEASAWAVGAATESALRAAAENPKQAAKASFRAAAAAGTEGSERKYAARLWQSRTLLALLREAPVKQFEE